MFKDKDSKLAYDRQHSKNVYAVYKADRSKAITLLGGCCKLCDGTAELHLHHLKYVDGSNYPRTSNGWSRIRRVREALAHPEHFCLLCPRCHHILELLKGVDFVRLSTLISSPPIRGL